MRCRDRRLLRPVVLAGGTSTIDQMQSYKQDYWWSPLGQPTSSGWVKNYYCADTAYPPDLTKALGARAWKVGENILVNAVQESFSGNNYSYQQTSYSDPVISTFTGTRQILLQALDANEAVIATIWTLNMTFSTTVTRSTVVNFATSGSKSWSASDGTYAGPLNVLLLTKSYSSAVTGRTGPGICFVDDDNASGQTGTVI